MGAACEYGIARSGGPADEPVSLAEAKLHCRVEHDADDDYITGLIAAARTVIEDQMQMSLVTTEWTMTLPRFPAGWSVELPRGPLLSVDEIAYVDENGDDQVMDPGSYEAPAGREVGKVQLAYAEAWPVTAIQADAVTITFTAGYGVADSVPAPIKHAVKFLVGHWYRNRESVVTGTITATLPQAVEFLLAPYCPGRY